MPATSSATTLESSAASVPSPSASEDPIVLTGLTHNYGTRLALDHLSFSVAPAQIFGLLGPNGSGKTTLFRILSTLMVPTGGSATIRGFNVATQPAEVRQQIGIVFQARSLDIKLTVEENLRHAGHLYGLSGKHLRARIADVLNRVALTDRAKDYVETLSGGMQRRVELAKGLIHSPSVLLLDEPSTGLDPGARRDLRQYLRTLRDDEGVTVLVTTHLMEEAEYCDRLAILSEGKLVALGSPADLKSTIGGDVVLFETDSETAAQSLAARMAGRFDMAALGNGAPAVLGNTVRLERENGHRFLTAVLDAFPGEVRGVSVSRPRLEDVFIQRTGHRFWTEKTDASETQRDHEKGGGHD
ncbi:MAG: type transport system ATP-binding protein [Acidobacteriaceae bacterium]|nr:type transport system ATP-binding protein [Acidobacteriaceae bacterium]